MSTGGSTFLDLWSLLMQRCPDCVDLIKATSEAEVESAVDRRIGQAVDHLERNSKLFATLNEDGLTAVFVGRLSGVGLLATQQTHSNGHVDITIELQFTTPATRMLGEAKIYRGPQYHIDGLKQLLGRYTSGREARGLLVVYVKDPDIDEKVKGIRDAMDLSLPEKQSAPTTAHCNKWAFLSTHGHSSGSDCRVGHFACNLHA